MKFTQIAASSDLTRIAVPIITGNSVLLNNYIEFFVKPGTAATIRKEGTSSDISGKTRALGESYDATTVEPKTTTAGRKFIGSEIQIDMAYEKMGYDIGSEFQTQLKRHMMDFPGIFHYMMIHGNPAEDTKQMTGLKLLTVESRKIKADTNGLQLIYGSDNNAKKCQQTFLEKLNLLIEYCQGNSKVLIMNSRLLAYINGIAREYIQQTKNEFGVPISMFNQVPMLNLGDVQTEPKKYAPIINFNETVGTAENKCASIYCVNFAEEDGMSYMTTQGGFEVYDMRKEKNWIKSQYELIVDSLLVRENAVSKLEGLYFPDSTPS